MDIRHASAQSKIAKIGVAVASKAILTPRQIPTNERGTISAWFSLSRQAVRCRENVNYAIKSSFLLSFLESVPDIAAKLKEPNTKERKFDDVVSDTENAAVLVVVY